MFARSKRSDGPRLPQGAEAALWSIVEVIPDPRNHLALTRDPTCEIRVSAEQIEAAAVAPVPTAAASASAVTPVAVVTPASPPITSAPPADRAQVTTDRSPRPRREPATGSAGTGVRWAADAAEVRHPAPVQAPPPPDLPLLSPDQWTGRAPRPHIPAARRARPSQEALIKELFAQSA